MPIKPELVAVPIDSTIMRIHRGYLAYTRFGAITSAFRYDVGNACRQALLIIDEFHDAIPHNSSSLVDVTIWIAHDFHIRAEFEVIQYDARRLLADMVGDDTHDALAVFRRQPLRPLDLREAVTTAVPEVCDRLVRSNARDD
jgi:hypothetical protein